MTKSRNPNQASPRRRTRPPDGGNAGQVDLDQLPGHHIRRLQQIAVALFLQETEPFALTPVQYAALQGVANAPPGIDQRGLARAIGLDTSTTGGVVDRLEARGLLQRNADPGDRRVRLLTITRQGKALLRRASPAMMRAQERILQPLPPPQRKAFMRMLRQLVEGNKAVSRAPSA